MSNFGADVHKFTVKTKLGLDSAFRLMAMEAFRIYTKRSPVDTGALRASWRIGVDGIDTSYVQAPRGPNAANSIGTEESYALAAKAVAKIKSTSTIHITNSAPWSSEVEMGKSKVQAPAGVLRPGTLELVGRLKALLKPL